MLGILVLLLLSWAALYISEKEHLTALGFQPPVKRLNQFLTGFAATAVLCTLSQFLEAGLSSSEWVLNRDFSPFSLLKGLWWDFKSVLTEELVFRGALLYILIKRISPRTGLFTSAVVFGVYHWFSFGIIGNIIPMIFIFIGTGLSGYAFALAFLKSKSILLPVGLHLGWNFVNNSIFSDGPLGEMLLTAQGGTELTGWLSLANYLAGMVLVPVILIVCLNTIYPQKSDS